MPSRPIYKNDDALSKKSISFFPPKKVEEFLEDWAEAERISRSELIRRIILDFAEKEMERIGEEFVKEAA